MYILIYIKFINIYIGHITGVGSTTCTTISGCYSGRGRWSSVFCVCSGKRNYSFERFCRRRLGISTGVGGYHRTRWTTDVTLTPVVDGLEGPGRVTGTCPRIRGRT